jgi:hypothetical protein
MKDPKPNDLKLSNVWIDQFYNQLCINDEFGNCSFIDLGKVEGFLDNLHFVLREHYTESNNPDLEHPV